MSLKPVSSIELEPKTDVLWDTNTNCTVEIADLGPKYLVRAAKTYRLLKQSTEGREKWRKDSELRSRSLQTLHDYLKDKFPHFQLSVNFTDTVVPDSLGLQDDARETIAHLNDAGLRRHEIKAEIEELERSREHGSAKFESHIDQQLRQKKDELQQVEADYRQLVEDLEKKKQQLGEWQENGTMLAYLFSFATDPKVCDADELDTLVAELVRDIEPGAGVKQTLEGPKFGLYVQELDEPRVFSQLAYSCLLNPASFDALTDRHPDLEGPLEELRERTARQYHAYATTDLETQHGTFERSKATPSRAVQDILTRLETQEAAAAADIPNDGPMIGTIPGTRRVVGFNPAEKGPHYYIAGKTGVGKSHLKRVLIENCVSNGYDVLAINPNSAQSIGIALPNEQHDDGTGIATNQYWIGDDRLLDEPTDIHDLFAGVNAVTLKGAPQDKKESFVETLFQELYEIDHSDKPLYVFLDEAQVFNTGKTAEAIQQLAQEGRKFSVNLVLVSQSPKSFSYNHREVRRNTSFILMNAKYAPDIKELVDHEQKLSDLDQGQAVFADFLDIPEIVVDIRETMTRLWDGEPPDEEIAQVETQFDAEPLSFDEAVKYTRQSQTANEENLADEQAELLGFIRQYIEANDKRPTYSRCWRDGPFGSERTQRLLDELEEVGVVETSEDTRYGNETTVYGIK